MDVFVILGAIVGPLALSLILAWVLLVRTAVPALAARPSLSTSLKQPQPVWGTISDERDQLIAELSGLLCRHIDMLPQNYDEFPAWDRLVEDTVSVLTMHKLIPKGKIAAERQCATLH